MRRKKQILENISNKYFRTETLKTRNSDELDFYNVSIWDIQDALNEAFREGQHFEKNK